MNINPQIEEIFKDFEVDGVFIPIAFLNYYGKSDVYLTYYTWLEQPQEFHDDNYHASISYATIDIFSKTNFKNILASVKQKLKENGFTWIDNSPETYEPEIEFYHVAVNFYIEGTSD
ncbi:hypothetical protein FACS189465_2250 [Clostridia bacterium]|nr:hypothetical protein FACS189465_2250 [Clostridia bacterium]